MENNLEWPNFRFGPLNLWVVWPSAEMQRVNALLGTYNRMMNKQEEREMVHKEEVNKVQTSVEKLAEDHWNYVEKTLYAHQVDADMIDVAKYHYIASFLHGYKHGVEDTEDAFYGH